MKKVLYVSPNGYIGGAEKFLVNIASIHAETEDKVHFLLFEHGPLEDELKKIGVPVTVLSKKFRVRNVFQLYSAIREIRSFLKKYNFDIIHSTMAYSHFVMGLATCFSSIKRVWFQHGPVGGMFDHLASIFRVDILLFSSHYLMDLHYDSWFLRQARYGRKVIPLPVAFKPPKLTDAFALKKSLNLEGVYVLGMMGRISRGKGFEIAIKSFLDIDMPDAKLVIVGSANKEHDKIYLQELKDIISKKNAEDKVLFVPHQSNLAAFYKILDIYLNPVTINEGFGLAVAEAMAAGIPVISSPYGGLKEFVKENETAEIVFAKESDAVESLKQLIQNVRSNEIRAKTLAKNARELIESRFNYSQTYVAMTDVYQYLASLD